MSSMMANGIDDSGFPVMYIDPVYATVTSKTSNVDFEYVNEEWRESIGLSGGIIQFLSQGNIPKKPNVSYFVKMIEDTSTNMVTDYMDKAWKFRSPNIVLSIISSPDHWKPWMNQKQKEDFQKGIVKAVNTTTMWLLTNGKNSGVCKLIGDAIKMEKERRHVLASNYSRNIITTSKLEKLPKITAIGIVPISQLTYGDDFEGRGITIDLKNQGNMSLSESVELNPDLTNFIMLDVIKTQREVDSKRLQLEDRFRRPVGKPKQYGRISDMNEDSSEERHTIPSTSTPLVSLLIQGSPCDIEHVTNLIKMKVPVIIVKGTGSAADLFSFAYDELQQRPDEDHLNSYIKPELLKRIQKAFPVDFKNDVLSRNKCRDMIIECVQFSMRVQQNFLTILDIETDPNGLKNLDKYILFALFESQEPKKDRQIQEQIQSNLKLTLDWNRSDLALSKIFQKYDWMSIKISKDLFDMAMVKRDRHKFVELFLDKQAIELNRYFTFRKLVHLINHYEDPEFFRTICLGEILGYSPISDFPVKKRFVYGERCALNILLDKTTYLSNLVSTEDFDMDEMEEDGISPAIAERKARNVLVYWAALNFDIELTKTFWKKTEEPMAMAFIVSMIWYSIAKKWCPDPDTKKKLLVSAKEFGEMAVKLLQYSYQDSNLNTIAFLDKRLDDFNNKTIIELAHIAKNKHFIAHSVCQKWLNRRWAGNLLIKKLDWGPIKIPNWVKIYLSLVFVFPMFFWITYDLADKERRDRIMEDDDDHTLLDEPNFTRQPSVIGGQWISNPSQAIAYKMKSVWNSGKERFKVPIYLQFYYLWSAPITKFWINQIFYILFLILFSVATLHPNCGMIYLDLTVLGWVLMIWLELVRSTFMKRKKYKELDLFWTVLEIFLMASIFLVIFALRITPYFVTYFRYPTTKFVMSLGLLYTYYRVLFVFTPISPVLGPMLISIKRMITHDFLTWFRMFLIIMVSGAVTIHAVLYPNYPLVFDSVKQSLARALFAMFLTKIDDLEGDPSCSYMYKNTSVSRCYALPHGSFYSEEFNTDTNYTMEENEYRRLAKCPHTSLGGYAIVIQYLLIVKLIMVTLLYALFSSTNSKVQGEAEDIWKFQKYSLIVDFEEKLILPPPLNVFSYIIMIIQKVYYFIRYCYRRCRRDCSQCCRKKHDFIDGAHKLSTMALHSTTEYSYWNSFVKKLGQDEKQDQDEKDRTKTQSQILASLVNQLAEQRQFDGRLVKQISCLEENVTNCQVALEELQHMMEKLRPNLHPNIVSDNSSYKHVLSRQSPYPKTTVQRFPVFTKYVSWEIPYSVYDPAVYSCPVEKFPEQTQPYVDPDYLNSILRSKVVSLSQEDVRDITSKLGNDMPVWNTSSTVTINGQERVIDRSSFIKKCGIPITYQLDSCSLPINPKGRTGLRGRGRLIRWGPNHNVMVVITRWKKKENSEEILVVDDKKVMEVIAIKENENVESKLPRGGDYGYMTMYSAVCKKFLTYTADDTTKQINPDMNETDMIKFFRESFPLPGPLTPFTSNMIYKGYFDDTANTDNAWREVEVWNFHFDKGGDIYLKFKDNEKKWKTVSSYNTFHGSQDLILRQAATLHNSYY